MLERTRSVEQELGEIVNDLAPHALSGSDAVELVRVFAKTEKPPTPTKRRVHPSGRTHRASPPARSHPRTTAVPPRRANPTDATRATILNQQIRPMPRTPFGVPRIAPEMVPAEREPSSSQTRPTGPNRRRRRAPVAHIEAPTATDSLTFPCPRRRRSPPAQELRDADQVGPGRGR
jgi:hypothetical protein